MLWADSTMSRLEWLTGDMNSRTIELIRLGDTVRIHKPCISRCSKCAKDIRMNCLSTWYETGMPYWEHETVIITESFVHHTGIRYYKINMCLHNFCDKLLERVK